MTGSGEAGRRSIGPIFVSHATVDKVDVIALCDALRIAFNDQIRTFNTSAAAIAPGDRWRDRILEAIRGSSLVILWATSHGLESREVAFDVGAALASAKPLIPCCVHVAPGKLPWSLSEIQALTLLDKEDGWIRLAETVGNIINYSGRIDEEPLRRLSERFRATNDAIELSAVGRTVEIVNTSASQVSDVLLESSVDMPAWTQAMQGTSLKAGASMLVMRHDSGPVELLVSWTDVAGVRHARSVRLSAPVGIGEE